MTRRFWSKILSGLNRAALINSARTAIAAIVSLLVARLFALPETYWAAVSTVIVMQSSLGASLPIAIRRFSGAFLGASLGALIGYCFKPNIWIFGAGVFVLGLICAILCRVNKSLKDALDSSAYRYASITLAITILIPRSNPPWIIALHRFSEVSLGIVVALAMSVIWPERSSEG